MIRLDAIFCKRSENDDVANCLNVATAVRVRKTAVARASELEHLLLLIHYRHCTQLFSAGGRLGNSVVTRRCCHGNGCRGNADAAAVPAATWRRLAAAGSDVIAVVIGNVVHVTAAVV